MSRRSFDDLRKPAPPALKLVADEPVESVARRLFMTGADGPRVLGWLLDRVHQPSRPNASDADLREAEGARRFMHDVVSAMSVKSTA